MGISTPFYKNRKYPSIFRLKFLAMLIASSVHLSAWLAIIIMFSNPGNSHYGVVRFPNRSGFVAPAVLTGGCHSTAGATSLLIAS